MMQGDSYSLGIVILNNAGSPVGPGDIRDIEITIGHLTKTYRNAEVTHQDGEWFFPISQSDSFSMWPSEVKAQVRVAWANGAVEGQPIYGIRNEESLSKEVL